MAFPQVDFSSYEKPRIAQNTIFQMYDLQVIEDAPQKTTVAKKEKSPEKPKVHVYEKQPDIGSGVWAVAIPTPNLEDRVEGSSIDIEHTQTDSTLYTSDMNRRYTGFVESLADDFLYTLPIEDERMLRQFIKANGDSLVYSMKDDLIAIENRYTRGKRVGWTGGNIIMTAQKLAQFLHHVDGNIEEANSIMDKAAELGILKDVCNVDLYATIAQNRENFELERKG